jgi:HSP20 family protein
MWTSPIADFAYLHDQMDRIAQEMLTRTNGATVTTLPVDVYDRGEEIVVQAYVPGVQADHLDIQVEDSVLTISGTFPQLYDREESGSWTWHTRELRGGNFQRSLSLPFKVDFDQAQAQIEDGILRMTFPKAAEAKPRRISVTGHSSTSTPELSETISVN